MQRRRRPHLLRRAAVSLLLLLKQAMVFHEPISASFLVLFRPVESISIQKLSGVLRHGRPAMCAVSPASACLISQEFPYPPNRRLTKIRPLLDYRKDIALHTNSQPMERWGTFCGPGLVMNIYCPTDVISLQQPLQGRELTNLLCLRHTLRVFYWILHKLQRVMETLTYSIR